MDQEQKDLIASERADHAKRLLDDAILKEAFERLESAYVEEMVNTGVNPSDSYKRDRLHQAVHIVRKVKGHLARLVEDGKISKAQLAAIAGRRAA